MENRLRHAVVAIGLMASVTATSAAEIYFSDFEANDGGWTESGFGDWERGTISFSDVGCDNPGTVGPSGAYSGSNVWGTILNTCYNNSGAESRLSQTFDLAGFTDATFSWYQWVHVFVPFDVAQFLANGDLLYERADAIATADWEQQTVSLTPYVGGLVTIEFELSATTVVNRAGWYIDDVLITGTPSAGTIPEPGTLALLAIALAGLGFSRRRRYV